MEFFVSAVIYYFLRAFTENGSRADLFSEDTRLRAVELDDDRLVIGINAYVPTNQLTEGKGVYMRFFYAFQNARQAWEEGVLEYYTVLAFKRVKRNIISTGSHLPIRVNTDNNATRPPSYPLSFRLCPCGK